MYCMVFRVICISISTMNVLSGIRILARNNPDIKQNADMIVGVGDISMFRFWLKIETK